MELLACEKKLFENVNTSENSTDMLTKSVISDKFKHFMDLLHVSQC